MHLAYQHGSCRGGIVVGETVKNVEVRREGTPRVFDFGQASLEVAKFRYQQTSNAELKYQEAVSYTTKALASYKNV